MGKVSFAESLSVNGRKVAGALATKGFVIASLSGVVASISETTTVGLLVDNPNRPVEGKFLGFGGRRRRDFVGVLWLSNEARRANHKNWVLEVYGRENVARFQKLAEELARDFEVDIHVRLEREEVDTERFPEDFFM
jgi:hypothetical protein